MPKSDAVMEALESHATAQPMNAVDALASLNRNQKAMASSSIKAFHEQNKRIRMLERKLARLERKASCSCNSNMSEKKSSSKTKGGFPTKS